MRKKGKKLKFDKPTLHHEWACLFGTKSPRIKHTSINMHHEQTPKRLFLQYFRYMLTLIFGQK